MAQRYLMKEKLHGKEILGKWPSNSQFPFHFIQEKNSFQDIQEYILKKENLTIFVTKTFEAGDEVVISKLHERLEDLGKGLSKGMVHVTKCLTILLNLDPIEIPKGILWELFCCLPDRPCTLLFLVTSTSNNALKTYSLNLTRNALCKMRKFTDEHFSIIYGLITENDLQSKESFVACLEKIEEETSVFCNPDSLQMTVEKCKNITKAFLASIASTDLVTILKDEEADKDTLWFLTLQQFCVLVENIDEEVVYLESVPGSGGTFILTEVARRLCKIGNTVLSIERELKETISRKNVVSLVVSPEKLHKVNLIDFKHIVAEGVSLEVEGLKSEAPNRIKVWLLNSQNAAAASQEVNKQQQGQQHTPGSHPQDAETVEIRDRGHDGDDDNGVDEEGYCSAVTDSDEDMYFSTNEDELNLAQGTWIKRKSCEIFERSKKEICSQVSNTASSHMEAVVKKRLKDRSTLSIIGFPGEGKTTLACQVLMDYLKEDWKVYILHEPQEYFCLELKDKCIILFKDIFGQANFDEECYKKWASVLNDIVWQAFHVPKQYRVLYTLFLFRKDIFQKAWTHSTTYNVLFKHELDVHNMDILDIPEKETIVKKGQSESESESEQISKRLAEKSPLLLRMYSLMSTKPSTLREFSMDPEPYLIQTVNSLVKNEEYLRTFRLLIHHDNIPDLTQIENNYSVVKHLCESAGLLTVRPKSILNVVNVLDGLIINRSNGYITFCHSRISEIVASVLSKHDSNHYIEYCSLTHLAYTHPPIFDELNPPHSIEIENKVAPVLGRRLVSEVKKGNVKFVLVHVALSNPEVEAVMLANTEGLLYVRDIKSGMCFLELLPYCWSKRMQKWALKENILSDQILKIMYTCCCCGNIKLLHDLLHKYQGLFMSQIHLSQNPVTVSAQWNNTEVCRLLLKHLDVNSQDGDGNTALHHASANGNISLVNDLMHMKKIQCDVVNKRGETPLHKAVYHRQDNVAEMLLHAGANPHLRDNTGMTVLLAAAASGATDVITELLERESDIMDTDIHGNTVIHIAAHFGHDSLVQRLTQTSLNISQTNHSGMTHLHIAARNGKHLAVKHLLDAEMGKSRRRVSIHGDDKKETQELVRSQSLNTQDNFGMTPLHYASMWGHIVVIGTLLTHKCNVCSTTNSGQTALHLAAENGHIQATKTLTEHGSDVNAQDELGRTPLHAAVSRGNVKVVKCLLRGNADVRIRDKCGRTALELAKHQKRKPVLQVFKRHVNHEKSNDFSRSEHERGEKERPNCKSIVGGILGVVAAVFICYYLKWQ